MIAMLRRLPGFEAYLLLFLVVLYLPNIIILMFSFNDGIHVALPMKGLTTRWYSGMTENRALIAAAANSLKVAAATSVISTIVGMCGALAVTRYRRRSVRIVGALSMMPLLLPGVVLGVSLLILARLSGIGNSLTAVTLGHIVYCTPLALAILASRLAELDPSLEEAALDLGANPLRSFAQITMPLSAAAIASSLTLTFVTSFDEFIIAFFLAGTDVTLPLYMWGQLRYPNRLPEILALATCILSMSLVAIMITEALRRRGSATGGIADASA